ncbi:gluconolaconase [Allostreptomyces psammosilenae]|uniref:Sugar lactone lactonase YvrE n=1 Tax=Allostreptomyces psammosilenae TaxID=1892865 RepID=A0A853A2I3_9ACTN|nr:gluconolaconase [Allostreptomyces psammosilenae]NYI07670.1 sugar lactone lactonase YvrE [Allostreptomyces psammosilenae]
MIPGPTLRRPVATHPPLARPSLSRRRLLGFAAATAVSAAVSVSGGVGGLLAGPRRAFADTTTLPGVLNVSAPGLYPEGVAWDPSRETFLVGSGAQGSVSVVDLERLTVTTLVPPIGRVATQGLAVDGTRGRVLAAYNNWGPRLGDPSRAAMSGLGVFDLASGETLHLVDISAGGRGETCANDVTVDEAGYAYVTDSAADRLIRVDPDGRVTHTITAPGFETEEMGLNGVVVHPEGFLLVGRYEGARLFRVADPAASDTPAVTEVPVDPPLTTIDGMALRADGSLIVVSNDMATDGEPGHRDAVTILRSDDSWASAHVAEQRDWPEQDPSTVAVTPYGEYVLSGRIREIFEPSDQPPTDFVLRAW